MLRRFIYAVIIVFCQELAFLQIMVLVFMQSLLMAFTPAVHPYSSRFQNKLETFNEAMALACTYFLFIFSDWVPDPYARHLSGWFLIVITMTIFGTNMFIISKQTVTRSYQKCMRKWRKRKYMQSLEQIKLKEA